MQRSSESGHGRAASNSEFLTLTVKGGTRHLEARDVDMLMTLQMDKLGNMKPGRKLIYYYCQNNNTTTRSLESLLIE